jgi:hypothetical protein
MEKNPLISHAFARRASFPLAGEAKNAFLPHGEIPATGKGGARECKGKKPKKLLKTLYK